ncbi:hypothetical protein, partial [Shewanella algae]|uniref:hypothetical protein n=1 Tax=Shewanella algae TaxID=38313 RepID=UPI001C59C60B
RRQEVITIFFSPVVERTREPFFFDPVTVVRVAAVPCQWERIIGSQIFCARAFYKKKDRLPIF